MQKCYINSKAIVFVVLLTAINFFAYGQHKELLFRSITTDHGLASSNILSIIQDTNGFMWIGTYDGLHRYDGKNIKIYQHNINQPNTLPDNLIRDIYIDQKNNMFIGTNTGISLYNKSTDDFINFNHDSTSCLYNSGFHANDIELDSKGNIWVATNIGLLRFDHKNNVCDWFKHEPDNPESLSNSFCTALHIDDKDRIWVSTHEGFNLFNFAVNTFEIIKKGKQNDDFSNFKFLKIAEDQSNNLWINSEEGLFKLNLSQPNEYQLQHFSHRPRDPYSISGNMLSGIYTDKNNGLWIGAENNGLYRYNRGQENFFRIHSAGANVSNLDNISVNAITHDNAGNLWLGTYGHGVLIASPNSAGISLFQDIEVNGKTFSSTLVNSFLEDQNGMIWIGTDGNGLFSFDKKSRAFKNYSSENSGLQNNYILSMVKDDSQNLWLATWDGGLIRFNIREESFQSFTMQNSEIPDNKIYTVAKDRKDQIWLGSHYDGLIHFDPQKKVFTSINKISEDLGENTVNVVKPDSQGKLFVATTKGVVIYSPGSNSIEKFVTGNNEEVGIEQIEINDLEVENDTSIWVGTLMGLYQFNPVSGKTSRFTTNDGLPADIINALEFDHSKFLWVTTSNGLCRLNPGNMSVVVFNKNDGMQSNEFRPRSALLDSEGDLFIGGINGFNIINPDKIERNKNIPAISLTGMDIFHIPVKPGEPGAPLQKVISETEKIVLNHDQSVLTFHFAVLDFTSPGKNQHAYMLENFDNDWTYCGNSRQATYTNLDPGEYVFRVKGANNDGIWNEEEASLKIIITPPWWQTWWFKVIAGLTLAFLIFIVFYTRITSLKRRQHILEQRVEERTRELARLNATKDKLFSIISHDLRSPFNVILGYTDVLRKEYKTFDEKTMDSILANLSEAGESAFSLLENLLNWSGTQRGTTDFSPVETTANEMVKSVLPEIKSIARKKNIEIVNHVAEKNIKLKADKNMLSVVLRNLLNNAIKFSNPGSKIWLNAEAGEQENIVFSVQDEGVGMSPEKAKTLFKLEETTTENGTKGEKGTGIGLILCKEFVEMHGGEIWVESQPGKGTIFYFSVR